MMADGTRLSHHLSWFGQSRCIFGDIRSLLSQDLSQQCPKFKMVLVLSWIVTEREILTHLYQINVLLLIIK